MKLKTSELTGRDLDAAVARTLGHRVLSRHEYLRCNGVKHSVVFSRPDSYALLVINADQLKDLHPSHRLQVVEPYSTDWSRGGPIIERVRLHLIPQVDAPQGSEWHCSTIIPSYGSGHWKNGPTALIAAMRCFVASKFGDEVDLPTLNKEN